MVTAEQPSEYVLKQDTHRVNTTRLLVFVVVVVVVVRMSTTTTTTTTTSASEEVVYMGQTEMAVESDTEHLRQTGDVGLHVGISDDERVGCRLEVDVPRTA